MLQYLTKKLSLLALIAIIFFNFAPITLAQSDITSPLDDIKDRLRGICNTDTDCDWGDECDTDRTPSICVDEYGNPTGIDVIDYSENVWGRLSERVIAILEDEGYTGMNYFVEGFNLADIDEELSVINELTSDDIELIKAETIAYQYLGERQLRDTAQSVITVIRNIIAGLAVIWIIISGIRMILAQGEENVITEQRQSIIYAVIGLVAILLIERLIDVLYGTPGTFVSTYSAGYIEAFDESTEARFSAEIYGVINYVKAIIGAVAIFMMVISGIRLIVAAGEEEQITKQRKVFIWIIVGLILLAIDQIVIENLFSIPVKQQAGQIAASNITALINLIGRVTQFILGFVGLIALGMLVYGAGMLITNYANTELVDKAKKIIKNAIIGIIIIISAYTLIATLIMFK
ncbi:pilin [Patescibacteria group bacterium]|nr:pilin [Patescibacteria group bacterium]